MEKWQVFFAGSTGKGMENYTEEQILKIYNRSFWQNEKVPQKLGPILFAQCKVSVDPREAKCRAYLKDTGQEGK